MTIRDATREDVPVISELRAEVWGTIDYWMNRVAKYLKARSGPMEALAERKVLVCESEGRIVGFIAGHLTTRYDCQGELQWLNVTESYTRKGIASQLLKALMQWFMAQNAQRICVDVEPDNEVAEKFYSKHGAVRLNEHWMIWENLTG